VLEACAGEDAGTLDKVHAADLEARDRARSLMAVETAH